MEHKSSEKLKEAMAEIRAVCKKHDIVGYIVLADGEKGEFCFHTSASWNVIRFNEEGNIRVISKLEDYGGDKDLQNEHLDKSANALTVKRDLTKRAHAIYKYVWEELNSHLNISVDENGDII